MPHQVGVGRVFEAFVCAAFESFADAIVGGVPRCLLFNKSVGLHPTVAVGELAIVKMCRMHHAIAIKRVVTAVGRVPWVGAGPQVNAVEVFRDAALDDLQIRQLQLFKHRRINTCEQRAIVFAMGCQILGGGACVHATNLQMSLLLS